MYSHPHILILIFSCFYRHVLIRIILFSSSYSHPHILILIFPSLYSHHHIFILIFSSSYSHPHILILTFPSSGCGPTICHDSHVFIITVFSSSPCFNPPPVFISLN